MNQSSWLEFLSGGFQLLLKVFVIIVPILMVLEIVRDFKFFDKAIEKSSFIFGKLGFEKESLLALLAGLFFGIGYGAGVLIEETKASKISSQQVLLICVFLGMCHAVVEDTLLFVAVGANGWYVLGSRLILAVIFTFIVSLFLRKRVQA